MTAHPPEHSTDSPTHWAWAAFGVMAVAALIAAMVWVVQGQVQQAQVLRAQWQGTPRAVQAAHADPERNAAASQAGAAARPVGSNGVMAASFHRP